MKQIRIDFSKGINSRVDPRLLGEGFLLVSDNTETRSGLLKPVTAPEISQVVDPGHSYAWEYRGRWITSKDKRDFAAEYVGLQERIYWTSETSVPQKMVDGVTANLGCHRPNTLAKVEAKHALLLNNLTAEPTTGGSLVAGGYGYRLGLRTKLGYLLPSPTIYISILQSAGAQSNAKQGAVRLKWSKMTVANLAVAYGLDDPEGLMAISAIVIYGRNEGRERVIAELPVTATEFLDDGSAAPFGPTAESFESKAQVRYFYTFLRDTNGHRDESGPSELTWPVDASMDRFISFDNEDGVKDDPYITARRLYRLGDVPSPSLVAELPTHKDGVLRNSQFVDLLPMSALGEGPASEYDDEDDRHIVFEPPPPSLKRITPHMGMLFGIQDCTLRCTPPNRPDAWPTDYAWVMPHPPVSLSSYGGALIILAVDGLYRLDGQTPGSMMLTRMPIEDGCIAPDSVCATPAGLLYLGRNGLMRYAGGMTVENLTSERMDARILLAPSILEKSYWWLPTKYGLAYAAQTADRPTRDAAGIAPSVLDTRVVDGPIEAIRAFCCGNRYYLYYRGEKPSEFGANTMICIDLGEPGFPITTLGMRPLDAHVTAQGSCFLLLKHEGGNLSENFHKVQQDLDQGNFTPPAANLVGLFRWGKGRDRVPWHVRTGPMAQGSPTERKRYRRLEFHGSGDIDVRVFVDGRAVGRGKLTATEHPSQVRRLNLPRSTWGYSLDFEACGNADLFAIELSYDGAAHAAEG